MRRGLALGLVVGVLNGGLAIAVAWWVGRRPATFGWYSYTPMPRRYADYLPTTTTRPGWQIALVVLVAFAVLNAAAGAAWFALRKQRAT